MWIVYLLVCCIPFAMIIAVFAAVIGAGISVGRSGMRAYRGMKPYIDDATAKVKRAEQLAGELADRGNNLQKTFEEIGGRWAFIINEVQQSTGSPAVKAAEWAGRFAAGRGER